jgi:isoamyl acetate esterase
MSPTSSQKKKIIFLGDSLTQHALDAKGYIRLMTEQLKQNANSERFELIGKGISGNTVLDLQNRLEKDVLDLKPDCVFVYIGINDVWRFYDLDGQRNATGGTPKDRFETVLREIVERIQKNGAQVVLCTPSVIGEKYDGSNPEDDDLEQYASVSRAVARQTKAVLCDLRKAFIDFLKKNNPQNREEGILTTDRVHFNDAGNQLVANEFMNYLPD